MPWNNLFYDGGTGSVNPIFLGVTKPEYSLSYVAEEPKYIEYLVENEEALPIEYKESAKLAVKYIAEESQDVEYQTEETIKITYTCDD